MTLANASQHLQILKNARLVESERRGTTVVYRLATPAVTSLWLALRDMASERLPEVGKLREAYSGSPDDGGLPRREIQRLLNHGDAVLIDVRPAIEFEHGHIAGAVSIPIEELTQRINELPRGKRIVAYCRGEYCLLADEAVALLRKHGFDAVRLEGGWPEWSSGAGRGERTGRRQASNVPRRHPSSSASSQPQHSRDPHLPPRPPA